MIGQFNGYYSFLSNFHYQPVHYDGITYPTSEHAFQAAKSLDSRERARIADCATPGIAKRAGRMLALRPDWEAVKLQIMEEIVRIKFENPNLASLLKATDNEELVEGNTWNDTFWGVCKGRGSNHLGKILMRIRSDLISKST
jgi:N-glycosidase YbiA